MLDGFELWLRKAGGLLLMGVVMAGYAVARERWWLPWRLMVLLAGIGAVVGCGVETWELIRSQEPTKTALDRLEAAEQGESP
ncbi:hypothetical protein [Streptomyces sp. NBC_00829]|uniref:hypothetical protein n=1 Tax=Streptomyces sp. NBC_00829 TaxID=2903679 RepID=UPI003865EFD2|nr:hypothetical protein OG293_35675 [Streptomyces sp. NBC_00829]